MHICHLICVIADYQGGWTQNGCCPPFRQNKWIIAGDYICTITRRVSVRINLGCTTRTDTAVNPQNKGARKNIHFLKTCV